MASSPLDESIFAQLRQPLDPEAQAKRDEALKERVQASFEKAQQRQTELIGLNATHPVTINEVRVLNANRTRSGFLERVFQPVLSRHQDQPYTLRDALTQVSLAVDKLNRLDIFHTPISTYIDKAEPTDASTTPTDHTVFVNVKEKGAYKIQTGTNAGTQEADAYVTGTWRNILGGAESLNGFASLGTRTRSAYSLTFDTPILSNPDLRFEVGGQASSVSKAWASHEEVLKGGLAKLLYRASPHSKHELQYSGQWRQVTGLAEKASPTVRTDAGDSFKSSLTHTWTNDTRDIPLMPGRGYLLKTIAELAGVGPLRGDVGFAKFEMHSQAAVPIPIPSIKGDSGVSFTAGLRGGVHLPLTLAGQQFPGPSRINDRFNLGGANDVRGFQLAGLGPRDGQDSVGGDIYAAGRAALLLPFPYVGKDTPLRFQAFINGGRLLAHRDTRQEKRHQDMSLQDYGNSLQNAFHDITNHLPSAAAGVGIVYCLPIARFEVNFSLPLVIRKGEQARKGVSFGIGLEFL